MKEKLEGIALSWKHTDLGLLKSWFEDRSKNCTEDLVYELVCNVAPPVQDMGALKEETVWRS